MVQLIEAELDAVDEEAEAAAARDQASSAEMNDTMGGDPAEDPVESDDEDESDIDQENNDSDEDSDTDKEADPEDDPDEATDGESEYGESGDTYTQEYNTRGGKVKGRSVPVLPETERLKMGTLIP